MRTPPLSSSPRARTSARWRRRTRPRACRRRIARAARPPARGRAARPRRGSRRARPASASVRSCVQSRIVASCSRRTSRMKSCTSSFERGSRPVVGSSSRSSTGEVSSARASATFCCIPRERCSIGSLATVGGEADALQDLRDPVAGLRRRHPVEACRVAEVLGGRHLLEERGLDRDPVDEPAHRTLSRDDVVAEDLRRAAVGEEQRREHADECRLPRAVLAQDGDALAALDRRSSRP